MYASEEYIKMCVEAREIQKKWKGRQTFGDFFVWEKRGVWLIGQVGDERVTVGRRKKIWLRKR